MKTYNEILKDIEKAKKVLKATEEKQENIINLIHSARDIKNKIEIKKEHHEQLNKLTENITDLTITIKMLKNNAKRALYVETIPAIIETLEKYNNKPYGEKTRDKISDEIKTITGCRCYVRNSYSDSEITIYPAAYGYDIKLYTKDIKILNSENKIQAPTAEQIKLYYIHDYIENIPAAIKAMKKAYKKAVEKQKELETICNEFNSYAVDGIERIYKDKYIYENFRG